MRLSHLLKRIKKARDKTLEKMGQHGGGMYARGLATEGFLGGYLACLDDVDAMATHGYPADLYDVWKEDDA